MKPGVANIAKRLLLLGLLLMVVVLAETYRLNDPKRARDLFRLHQEKVVELTPPDTSWWTTYENTEHGFSFRYPPDGFVMAKGTGVRIQNYPTSRPKGLFEGEYFIEVNVNRSPTCLTDYFSDKTYTVTDEAIIYSSTSINKLTRSPTHLVCAEATSRPLVVLVITDTSREGGIDVGAGILETFVLN